MSYFLPHQNLVFLNYLNFILKNDNYFNKEHDGELNLYYAYKVTH